MAGAKTQSVFCALGARAVKICKPFGFTSLTLSTKQGLTKYTLNFLAHVAFFRWN